MYSGSKKIIIAIDGFSSCGKSTLAKALAKKLNYIFIDTGAMYRAITLYCFENELVGTDFMLEDKIVEAMADIDIHFEFNPESSKLEITLNGRNVEKEIRSMQISNLVSKIATIHDVREKMVDEQRKIGQNGGVVMDGRDIGSVVFPHAELKLFITADPAIRAQRRHLELNNPDVSLEDVLKNLQERDYIDSNRKEGPLTQTADAIVIDNSFLSQEEQLDKVLQLFKTRFQAQNV